MPKKPSPKKPRTVNPASKAFLRGYPWRRLRWQVLKLYGFSCMACGRNSRDHQVVINVDHIIPRKERPDLALDPDNLQVLCDECNHGKGNLDSIDFRK